MKKIIIVILSVVSIAGLSSCGRLDIAGAVINRSDTEKRVEAWLEWNKTHGEPVFNNIPDSYSIYACSDAHYSDRNDFTPQDEDDRLYNFITAERNDSEAIFALINGDLANQSGDTCYKIIKESLKYNSATQADNDTCFAVIGNHDVYYDCAKHFGDFFHTSTYSVTVNTISGYKDKFVFLDSGNGTFGGLQTEWLKEQLADRNAYRHFVVISHNWIFRTWYNYATTPAANLPEDEQYAFMDMMSKNNVSLVLMGHFHYREQRYSNGVPYVMTDNLNESEDAPSYIVVKCGDTISYEYKELNN
jgi:UDP-2,3-diacylglucosamine pyrophosphatase LpxH